MAEPHRTSKGMAKVDFSQFATPHSLGRVALVGCLLGIFWGLHLALALLCLCDVGDEPRWDLLWQWAAYGKKDNHVLITHGIYRYLRHPSYVGFYYWSVGSQVLLNNVISSILFGYASWMFFRRRIPFEERSLMHHFPNEYAVYARQARIMIPFIPSPISEHAKSS
eukprot:scaffold7679_cov134-Cylindrotheca_fusiformis.AAC.5